MSLTPDPALDQAPPRHWRPNRLVRVCFAIFTFEIGLFLVVFPWVSTWDWNYLQDLFPSLEIIWDNPYFQGALTGLGLVNIYVACLEVVRLLRKK
jgi:hypothetical protein